MSNATAELIPQLNILLRLTATEAATARARVSQATSDATRRELTANAGKCDDRATAIRRALTELGGVPDALGVTLARAATAARLPLEQTVPVTEALLTDLALEHQLFDRSRLVKVLAHEASAPKVVALAERLEEAHGITIEWLFTVLAETAVGGPAALAATPVQAAAATARSTVTFAGGAAAKTVNKAVHTVGDLTQRVQTGAAGTVNDQLARARSLAGSAKKIFTAGRDASLATAESEADADNARGPAAGVHRLREGLGAVAASELPLPEWDGMTNKQSTEALQQLDAAADVRTMLAYERAHKNRSAIVTAAEKRISDIATELVNS